MKVYQFTLKIYGIVIYKPGEIVATNKGIVILFIFVRVNTSAFKSLSVRWPNCVTESLSSVPKGQTTTLANYYSCSSIYDKCGMVTREVTLT